MSANDERRQSLVDQLKELGIFDKEMLREVFWIVLVIPYAKSANPGALRRATYLQWQLETEPFAREQEMLPEIGVLMGFLSRFDLYGLEILVKHAREVGVKLTYARLLESAFQWATKIGDAYERVAAMRNLSGPNWKNVYLMLVRDGWNPFPPATPSE
ncbi:MAG: hypothetical protein PHW95_05080 [Patescibacteria group bacterium]|nr:hypothetical protein [Patescibacteria group bacterium]